MSAPELPQGGLAIRAGWDVSGTVFNTVGLLRELIAKASQDNVHPQAVLAAEALGAGILIAPTRLGLAKEVLSIHRNWPLQDTLITIGLHSGNTIRLMQRSTSLLQFFTFITAFKLAFINDEIADILYEMLLATNLLAANPMTPRQFDQFLTQVGAHAERFAPTKLMNQIVSKVSRRKPSMTIFHRLSARDIAKLFAALFRALQDAETTSVSLTGHYNGVWMATVLLWWFPDTSFLTVDDIQIFEGKERKVGVHIRSKPDTEWTIKVYKKTGHPRELICHDDSSEADTTESSRLPLSSLIEFMKPIYLHSSGKGDAENERFWTNMTGNIALSLISLLRQKGMLRSSETNNVKLLDIISNEWNAGLGSILVKYGFSHSEISACYTDILLKEISRLIDRPKLYSRRPEDAITIKAAARILQNTLKRIADDARMNHGTGSTCEFLYPACRIAFDVIMTCTTKLSATTFTHGTSLMTLDEILYIFGEFLVEGLDVHEFRSLAFQQILQEKLHKQEEVLVGTKNGCILEMAVLQELEPSTDPRKVFAMNFTYGTIRSNDMLFMSVREPRYHSLPFATGDTPDVSAQEFLKKAIQGEALISPYKSKALKLETHVSVTGEDLYLKQHLIGHGAAKEPPHRVSWLESIAACTLAHSFRQPVTSEVHDALSSSLMLTQKIYWGPVHGSPMPNQKCILVDTRGNELVKFFGIGIYASQFTRTHHGIFNYCGTSRSLLPMLHAASLEDKWIMFI